MDDRRSFFGKVVAAVLGLLGWGVAKASPPPTLLGYPIKVLSVEQCRVRERRPPHIEWNHAPSYLLPDGKAAYWTSLEIDGSRMWADEGKHLLETCLDNFHGSPAPREGFKLTSREWRYFPDDRVVKGVWRYEEI